MLVSQFLKHQAEEAALRKSALPCLVWGTLAGVGLAVLSAIIQGVM